MAEELSDVQKKLLIIIEEQIKGADKVAKALKDLIGQTTKADKSLSKLSEATDKTSKSMVSMKQIAYHVANVAGKIFSLFKKMALTVVGLGLAFAKLYDKMADANQGFLNLAMSSENSVKGIRNIQSSFSQLSSEGHKIKISMIAAARAIAEVGEKSMAMRAALSQMPEIGQHISKFQNSLAAAGMSAEKIREIMGMIASLPAGRIQDIFGDGEVGAQELDLLMKIQPELANVISQFKNLQKANEDIGAAIEESRKKLESLRAGGAPKEAQALEEQTLAALEAQKATAEWNKTIAELRKTWENASTKIFAALSRVITSLLKVEGKTSKFDDAVNKVVSFIDKYGPTIATVFEKIIGLLEWMLGIFGKLPGPIQATMLLLMMPGVKGALTGVIGSLAGIVSQIILINKLNKTMKAVQALATGTELTTSVSMWSRLGGAIKTAGAWVFRIGTSFAKFLLPAVFAVGKGIAAVFAGITLAGTVIAGSIAAIALSIANWAFGWELGEKLADKLMDVEGKMKRINEEGAKFKQGWIGAVEVKGLEKYREVFEFKKQQGKLKPGEETLEAFAAAQAAREGGVKDRETQKVTKREKQAKAAQDQAKETQAEIDKLKEKYENLGTTSFEAMQAFHNEFKLASDRMKDFSTALQQISGGGDAVGRLIDTMGINEMTEEMAAQVAESSRAARQIFMKDAQATYNAALKIYTELAKDATATPQQLLEAQGRMLESADALAQVQSTITTQLDAQLKTREKTLERLRDATELEKGNLEIVKGIYGAAGLSAKAQMNVVDALQKQKEIVASQLKTIAEERKMAPGNQALLEKELAKRKELQQLTLEQVNMLKELRDGYLDAVQAQAFGAGAFEKILITQEQNLGKALDTNIAKKNLLLGTTGDKARESKIEASRFSAQGYGMETLGGEQMTDDRLQIQMEEWTKNAIDPFTEAAMKMSGGLVGQAASLAANTDALNNFAPQFDKRLAAVAGMAGVAGSPAAQEVIAGEAGRTGATPGASGVIPVTAGGIPMPMPTMPQPQPADIPTGTRAGGQPAVPSGGNGPISKEMYQGCIHLMNAAQMADASNSTMKSSMNITDRFSNMANVGTL